MDAYYAEINGTAAWVSQDIGFLASRFWVRHLDTGPGVAEVSISGDFETTHIKVADPTTGGHPQEVELETFDGVSKFAVKGNGLDVAVRAWR